VANFGSISAVGVSIERFLNASFTEEQPLENGTTKAILVRTEDFDPANTSSSLTRPSISVFLYRVDFNKTMRAGWSAVGNIDGRAHLPLDLHFLLTPWSENAESELRILGRAMQALETTPIFGGPLLDPSGGFAPNESVQIILEEISTEAVMRTFDSLPTDYKLSVPYIARVLRIESKTAAPSPPVLTVASGHAVELG
jgi:uncharacterized protein DUF4255